VQEQIRSIETRVEIITPLRAANELERSKGRNYRTLNERWAKMIAEDITRGRFTFNHKPIEFDEHGILHDGQHRLRAVVLSGIPCRFVVVYGSQPVASEGAVKPRSASDHLANNGLINTVMVASTARVAICWERKCLGSSYVAAVSASEITAYAMGNPRLSEIVSDAKRIKVSGLLSSSVAAVCFIATEKIAHPHDYGLALRFIEELANGVGLSEYSPTRALRERAIKLGSSKLERQTKASSIALTILAWNYQLQNRACRLLRWTPSDKFPEIQ
jgi:hypothetical protein